MKYIYSDFQDRLTVTEDLTVLGTLMQGAEVAANCSLYVFGSVRGTVLIAAEGRLCVSGLLLGPVEENSGTIVAAGRVGTPIEHFPGTVIIAAGSTVSLGGARVVLRPDGSTDFWEPDSALTVSSTLAFAWDRCSGSFGAAEASQLKELVTLAQH